MTLEQRNRVIGRSSLRCPQGIELFASVPGDALYEWTIEGPNDRCVDPQ